MSSSKKVILVTGGTGLVGRAIKEIIEAEKNSDESWIFLGSVDGDLRFLFHSTIFVNLKYSNVSFFFTARKTTHFVYLIPINLLM